MVQLSHPYMTTGKTIALTRQTFVGKVMSLLFNTLCRFVIAFLPRSKCLSISWLQSPSAVIFGAPKKKGTVSHSNYPSIFLLGLQEKENLASVKCHRRYLILLILEPFQGTVILFTKINSFQSLYIPSISRYYTVRYPGSSVAFSV